MSSCICPAHTVCWRHAYSVYYLDKWYTEPPTREILFFAGYATVDMMPRGGVFAESLPLPEKPQGLCPAMDHRGNSACEEFAKWQKLKNRQDKKSFPNKLPRVPIPQWLRREVAARDHYKCVYCGVAHNTWRGGEKVRGVVDHFIPLAIGGAQLDPNNLVFACRKCNREKGELVWKRGQKLMRNFTEL